MERVQIKVGGANSFAKVTASSEPTRSQRMQSPLFKRPSLSHQGMYDRPYLGNRAMGGCFGLVKFSNYVQVKKMQADNCEAGRTRKCNLGASVGI